MADKNEDITLVAVGDVRPKRKYPEEVFDLIRPILKGADIAFGQLECSFSVRGTRHWGEMLHNEPSRRPSGISPHSGPDDPRGAKILSDAGFNVMSAASNHAMRWGHDGVLDTLDVMKANNIEMIGAGKNIEDATRPAIIERKGTKVGFLAYCSVVPRGHWATLDRAGVAPVRATASYEQFDWQPGTVPRIISKANPEDLAGMVEDIEKLRSQVDVLVVSMHWGVHFTPAVIAMYQHEIGHAAIDAGADLILGHHSHILKGIEVYKGKVIFFSLANCSMNPYKVSEESDTFTLATYAGRRYTTHLGYRVECEPDYPDESMGINMQKSILVKCDISSRKLQRVAFLPMWINPVKKKSQPEPLSRSDPRSDQVYQYMEWLCGDQGLDTKFSREGDEVAVVV